MLWILPPIVLSDISWHFIWMLRFLLESKKSNLIPKFLQFKLASRHLHNSVVYKKCQIKLLAEEIRAKWKRISILEKDTKRIREELHGNLSCLDFSYSCSLFLVANDKSISHHYYIKTTLLWIRTGIRYLWNFFMIEEHNFITW